MPNQPRPVYTLPKFRINDEPEEEPQSEVDLQSDEDMQPDEFDEEVHHMIQEKKRKAVPEENVSTAYVKRQKP